MAAIAEILYVWAKFVKWREARRKRKAMQQYETPSNDFVYFRPVESKDTRAIQKLEVPMQAIHTVCSHSAPLAPSSFLHFHLFGATLAPEQLALTNS